MLGENIVLWKQIQSCGHEEVFPCSVEATREDDFDMNLVASLPCHDCCDAIPLAEPYYKISIHVHLDLTILLVAECGRYSVLMCRWPKPMWG